MPDETVITAHFLNANVNDDRFLPSVHTLSIHHMKTKNRAECIHCGAWTHRQMELQQPRLHNRPLVAPSFIVFH